jgi:FkbM family methyltransferase
MRFLYPFKRRWYNLLCFFFPANIHFQLAKLSLHTRYTPGKFHYKQKEIIFPDNRSFVFTYKEIFIREIYKVKAEEGSPLIIDCGANIGLGIIYFKEQFPNARIIAFEPDKDIFSFLTSNVASNNLENIQLENKALWSDIGILSFGKSKSDFSRLAFDEADELEDYSDKILIETVKLSDYINSPVLLLKIDIEGAEKEVLHEIRHKLHFIENCFIEFHSYEHDNRDVVGILQILKQSGFKYYIDSPLSLNERPFVDRNSYKGINQMLNIYAYKN